MVKSLAVMLIILILYIIAMWFAYNSPQVVAWGVDVYGVQGFSNLLYQLSILILIGSAIFTALYIKTKQYKRYSPQEFFPSIILASANSISIVLNAAITATYIYMTMNYKVQTDITPNLLIILFTTLIISTIPSLTLFLHISQTKKTTKKQQAK